MSSLIMLKLLPLIFILFASCSHGPSRENQFVTFHDEDLKLFKEAFMKLEESNLSHCSKVIDEMYFKKGSQGLQSFVKVRLKDANTLCKTIIKIPDFYRNLNKQSLNFSHLYPLVKTSFAKLKKIYPETSPVEIYFLIGMLSTGGTVEENRLLIGTEMYAPSMLNFPKESIPPTLKKLNLSLNNLPYLIVHELIHSQQKIETEPKSLMENSIIEGVADFLTFKLTGKVPDSVDYTYGYQNELKLKNEFKDIMHGDDLTPFLYNMNSSDHPDMGYFIGFRIIESYFERQTDEKKAIQNILNIKDYQKIVDESQYFKAI
jgi:hypothetical protein